LPNTRANEAINLNKIPITTKYKQQPNKTSKNKKNISRIAKEIASRWTKQMPAKKVSEFVKINISPEI